MRRTVLSKVILFSTLLMSGFLLIPRQAIANSCAFGSIFSEVEEISPVQEACTVFERIESSVREVAGMMERYVEHLLDTFTTDFISDIFNEVLSIDGLDNAGIQSTVDEYYRSTSQILANAGLGGILDINTSDINELEAIYNALPDIITNSTGSIGIDPILFEESLYDILFEGYSIEQLLALGTANDLIEGIEAAIASGDLVFTGQTGSEIDAARDLLAGLSTYAPSGGRLGTRNPTLLAHLSTNETGNQLTGEYIQSIIGIDGQQATTEMLDRYAQTAADAATLIEAATGTLDNINTSTTSGDVRAAYQRSIDEVDVSSIVADIQTESESAPGITNTQDLVRSLVEIEGKNAELSQGLIDSLGIQSEQIYQASVLDADIAELLLTVSELEAQQSAIALEDATFRTTQREVAARHLGVLTDLEKKLDGDIERDIHAHAANYNFGLRALGYSALTSDPDRPAVESNLNSQSGSN